MKERIKQLDLSVLGRYNNALEKHISILERTTTRMGKNIREHLILTIVGVGLGLTFVVYQLYHNLVFFNSLNL